MMGTKGIYCRGCFYDLRKLAAGKCPECGRAFNPADEASISRIGHRRWVRKLIVRTLIVLIVIASLLGGSFYWWRSVKVAEYEREQAAAKQLEAAGFRLSWHDINGQPHLVGPKWLQERLKWPRYLERVSEVIEPSIPASPSAANNLVELHNVDRIFISTRYLTPQALKWIRNLETVTSLQITRGRDDPLVPNLFEEIGMANKARLESLVAASLGLDDKDAAQLAGLRSLRQAWLNGNSITSSGVAQLRSIPRLEFLELGANRSIDSRSAASLSGLTSIRSLGLQGTAIDDSTVGALAALPELKELRLRDTQVSDLCIKAVKNMASLKVLEISLRAGRRPGFTPQGVRELRSAKPELTIMSF